MIQSINMPLLLRVLYRIETDKATLPRLTDDTGASQATIVRLKKSAQIFLGVEIRWSAKKHMFEVTDWGVLNRNRTLKKAREVFE